MTSSSVTKKKEVLRLRSLLQRVLYSGAQVLVALGVSRRRACHNALFLEGAAHIIAGRENLEMLTTYGCVVKAPAFEDNFKAAASIAPTSEAKPKLFTRIYELPPACSARQLRGLATLTHYSERLDPIGMAVASQKSRAGREFKKLR